MVVSRSDGSRDVFGGVVSGNSLDWHFVKHGKSMGFKNADAYLKGARKFLDGSKSIKVQSFISAQGTYFKYNPITNEFGIINEFGGISTYFLPKAGYEYWLQQIAIYKP